jgi:hypothetical protein
MNTTDWTELIRPVLEIAFAFFMVFIGRTMSNDMQERKYPPVLCFAMGAPAYIIALLLLYVAATGKLPF